MRHLPILICIVFMGLLAACSDPQKDAARAQKRSYEAQEDVTRHRLDLVDEYRQCVKNAAGDALKIEACDSYLRAALACLAMAESWARSLPTLVTSWATIRWCLMSTAA